MSARKRIAACLALAALAAVLSAPGVAQAGFGLKSFKVTALNEDGSIDTQAGSHPYEYRVDFEMNQDAEGKVEGSLNQLVLDLPAGFVGDPQAVPHCTRADFVFNLSTACPGEPQVGVVFLGINGAGPEDFGFGVYNLTPGPGVPATIGFTALSNNSYQDASV